MYTVATPWITELFDTLINPKITEMITYKMVAQTNTLSVVTVPNSNVDPCSAKNEK